MPHWKVRFMRRGWEPPYPFGKTHEIVCAMTREEAKAQVPASPGYPITASRTTEKLGAFNHCYCIPAIPQGERPQGQKGEGA